MNRIKTWWNGMGRRGKIITVVVVILVFIVAAAAGAEETGDTDPVADATQVPTATQQPTATEDPTPTAEATPTPEPTEEPTATPDPTPTPEPTAAFADIELSGTGDAVPRFEIPADSAAIAEISHSGTSNFAIFTIAEDGTQTDLLVNTIGNYSGTVLFDEQSGQHSVGFEVTADGQWTIVIQPVTAALTWDVESAVSGTGDDVVRIDPPVSGLLTADVSHTGVSNFAIISYGGGPFGQDLLVNEIGAYDGEVIVADGTFLIEITADGDWSIAPS
jgi:hypothetical protein